MTKSDARRPARPPPAGPAAAWRRPCRESRDSRARAGGLRLPPRPHVAPQPRAIRCPRVPRQPEPLHGAAPPRPHREAADWRGAPSRRVGRSAPRRRARRAGAIAGAIPPRRHDRGTIPAGLDADRRRGRDGRGWLGRAAFGAHRRAAAVRRGPAHRPVDPADGHVHRRGRRRADARTDRSSRLLAPMVTIARVGSTLLLSVGFAGLVASIIYLLFRSRF